MRLANVRRTVAASNNFVAATILVETAPRD
jgi:hypothetical protein